MGLWRSVTPASSAAFLAVAGEQRLFSTSFSPRQHIEAKWWSFVQHFTIAMATVGRPNHTADLCSSGVGWLARTCPSVPPSRSDHQCPVAFLDSSRLPRLPDQDGPLAGAMEVWVVPCMFSRQPSGKEPLRRDQEGKSEPLWRQLGSWPPPPPRPSGGVCPVKWSFTQEPAVINV